MSECKDALSVMTAIDTVEDDMISAVDNARGELRTYLTAVKSLKETCIALSNDVVSLKKEYKQLLAEHCELQHNHSNQTKTIENLCVKVHDYESSFFPYWIQRIFLRPSNIMNG